MFAEPGTYEVTCVYRPSGRPDDRIADVKLTSPPVKIVVEKEGLGEARLKGVRENLDRLQLMFSVRPAEAADRPDRRYELRYVALGVNAIPREPHATWPDGKPIGADARITAEEAGKVVDVLARGKFFDRAVTPLGKEPAVKPPSLSISVSHDGSNPPVQYRLTVPLDLRAYQQLQDIRRWVGGDAGKLLDRFRQPMEKDVNAAP
jgi:hypothetical protein